MTHYNQGLAYTDLKTGDRTANWMQAISNYEAALQVYTETEHQKLWGDTQHSLGVAYCCLMTNQDAERLSEYAARAIGHLEAALRVTTEEDVPDDRTKTLFNLGLAHYGLGSHLAELEIGKKEDNLSKAIGCFDTALRYLTPDGHPEYWAAAQYSRGLAYRDLATDDRNDNVTKAITSFDAALTIYTEEHSPEDWASALNCKADSLRKLDTGDKMKNLEQAVGYYQAALRVFTPVDYPDGWAATQYEIGDTYKALAEETQNTAQLVSARASFAAAERGYLAAGLDEEAERAKMNRISIDEALS